MTAVSKATFVQPQPAEPKVVEKLDFSGLDLTVVEEHARKTGVGLLKQRFCKHYKRPQHPLDVFFDTFESRHPHIKQINLSGCKNISQDKRRTLGYSLRC